MCVCWPMHFYTPHAGCFPAASSALIWGGWWTTIHLRSLEKVHNGCVLQRDYEISTLLHGYQLWLPTHDELTVLVTFAPTTCFDLCTPIGPLDVHLKRFLFTLSLNISCYSIHVQFSLRLAVLLQNLGNPQLYPEASTGLKLHLYCCGRICSQGQGRTLNSHRTWEDWYWTHGLSDHLLQMHAF